MVFGGCGTVRRGGLVLSICPISENDRLGRSSVKWPACLRITDNMNSDDHHNQGLVHRPAPTHAWLTTIEGTMGAVGPISDLLSIFDWVFNMPESG